MKKNTLTLFLLLFVSVSNAQVGIGTIDPKATLEVKGNPAVVSTPDGVIAPRITRTELIAKTAYTTAQIGAILYVTDLSGTTNSATNNILQIGYYYYDGSIWKSMNASSSQFSFGDVKTGMQSTDHNGWIKLDGRAKSTLTGAQQAQATALGVGTNLPDATNTYLSQNGTTLGSVSGSNTKTIAQNQLPNATLSGSTANAGAHTHTYQDAFYAENRGVSGNTNFGAGAGTDWDNNFYWRTSSNTTSPSTSPVNIDTSTDGLHSHTFTTSSINGGVTQQNLDIKPRSLSVNTFLYLGE